MKQYTPAQIRKLRKKLGITQGELADRCGVKWTTICRWENGKSKPRPKYQEAMRKLDRPTKVEDRVFEAEKIVVSSILHRWRKERGIAYSIVVVDGDDIFARLRVSEERWKHMQHAMERLTHEIDTQQGDVKHDIKEGG